MGDNLGPGRMDVLVLLNEMGSNDCSKKLRRGDRMLLGQDVDGIFHGICGYDDAVVCFGVSITFQLRVICKYIKILARSQCLL